MLHGNTPERSTERTEQASKNQLDWAAESLRHVQARASERKFFRLVQAGAAVGVLALTAWAISAYVEKQAEDERRILFQAERRVKVLKTRGLLTSQTANTSLGSELPKFERMRLLMARIDKAEAAQRQLAIEFGPASREIDQIAAELEYNQIVKAGHAGTKENLILARKILDNPAYEDQLRYQLRRLREQYSVALRDKEAYAQIMEGLAASLASAVSEATR